MGANVIKLIAGLGNPGSEYSATRHNAGFRFLDRLAEKYACSFSNEPKFFGEIARLQKNDIDCRLLKPATYMNESGRAVLTIMDYFKITSKETLIVHDEIDFEPGIVRLKIGGGHAGHNGLRDIIEKTGSRDFIRLRIGVGHPGDRDKVISSVLSKPSADEQSLIDNAIDRAVNAMPVLLRGEYNKVMTELHNSNEPQATSDKNEK